MADLKAAFLSGVASVYKTLKTLQRPVILVFGHGAYTAASDQLAPGTQSAPINAFIYQEQESQATDSSGLSSIILLQNSDVIAAGLSGKVEQSVKAIVDGKTIEVDFVGYDPVAATVKLRTRH